jgi:hypothetical protein
VRLRIERLVIGFCLTALGVLWTLANLGQLELLTTLRTWWPLSLLVWGGLELVDVLVLRPKRGK